MHFRRPATPHSGKNGSLQAVKFHAWRLAVSSLAYSIPPSIQVEWLGHLETFPLFGTHGFQVLSVILNAAGTYFLLTSNLIRLLISKKD